MTVIFGNAFFFAQYVGAGGQLEKYLTLFRKVVYISHVYSFESNSIS